MFEMEIINNRRTGLIVFLSMLFVVFTSCDKDSNGNKTLSSQHNNDKSHKNSQDCMSCHQSGGRGDGWFVVAGSVYDASLSDPNPNGTIKFYEGPIDSGVIVMSIEVDGKGNFYTTENVDFGNGLYTSVTGSNGNVKEMISPISDGACNRCHESSVDRIWVD